jgi:hypothetical protein
MASKKKTTFAKLNREQKLRERRVEKQMRKDARKLAAVRDDQPAVDPAAATDERIV